MKTSRRPLAAALALLALLVAGIAGRAALQTYLLEPLARILWLAGRTFMVVDQGLYWAALALVVLVVALRLFSGKRLSPPRAYHHPPARPQDRLAYWDALLSAANHDADARLALERELESLARALEPESDGSGTHPEVRLPPVRAGWTPRLRAALRRSAILGRRASTLDPNLKQGLDPILQSIANKLEMKHESHPGDGAGG